MAAKKKRDAKQEETEEQSKEEVLANTLASLEHKFGKGTIMKMGEAPHIAVEAIPTGSIGLDVALGIGGL